ARMVGLYRPLVRYWCGRQGVVGADAEDLTQEVFQVAAARMGDFRRDRPGDTFRGWLRGITRFKVQEHRRAAGEGPRAVGGSTAQFALRETPAEATDPGAEEDPPS